MAAIGVVCVAGRRPSAVVVVLTGLLAGCAGRPGPEVLVPVAAAPEARIEQIYVATTRTREAPDDNVFTAGRAAALNFARFTISVPPGHRPGRIEWPRGRADARVSFATVGQTALGAADFLNDVAPPGRGPRGADKRQVLIFVHGYNNTFQESLFRLAQMHADTGDGRIPVLFSWPSRGTVAGYVADKDAVTYSRDYLVALLSMVAQSPQVGEITLVAHSMGCWLTAEALRQLRLEHRDKVIARLSRVVLAAPDIDVDVFRAQLAVIGPLSPPMLLLVSTDDRALRLSSLLAGQEPRVGALDIDNPAVREAADRARLQIVDISQLRSGDRMNHDRFAGLAALYPKLHNQAQAHLDQAGTFSLDAVKATITAPFRVGQPAPAQ